MMSTLLMAALLAPQQDEDLAKKIDALVRDLGAEDFETREKATAELKKIGKPAIPALKKAAESEDAEVKVRAKALLEEFARAEKKPEKKRGFSRISVNSTNGDTSYVIVPSEGDPITFQRLKDGGVQLEYVEKGEAKTAKAESLAKFLEAHKELAAKYGITEDGIAYGGAKASFKGGGPQFRFDWDEEMPMPDFQEEMEKLRKLLEENDWGWKPGFEFDEEWLDNLRSGGRTPSAHGASFSSVDEVLRSHLDIPEGSGLVVRKVKDATLAAEFGLKKNDILLEIDGAKIASAKDVKSALKKESKLTILRGGKRTELKAKE